MFSCSPGKLAGWVLGISIQSPEPPVNKNVSYLLTIKTPLLTDLSGACLSFIWPRLSLSSQQPFLSPSWPHTQIQPTTHILWQTTAHISHWMQMSLNQRRKETSFQRGLRRLHDSLSYLLPLACWYFMWAGWNWLWSGWDFKLLICSLILKGLKRCCMFGYNFSTSINFCHIRASQDDTRALIHCYLDPYSCRQHVFKRQVSTPCHCFCLSFN